MARSGFGVWRVFFLLSALLILAGGPRHPGGSMAEMLADPAWVPAHALMLAAFVMLLAGLYLYGRSVGPPDRTRTWVRLAMAATALQAVEMAVHTAAVVDAANLAAGRATPVLTVHLWLSVVFYPVFGLALAGLVVTGVRDRTLGSPWIAWLGVAGALAHGAAAPLTILTGAEWARWLFPMLVLFALWLALTAVWPSRARPVPGGTADLRTPAAETVAAAEGASR